MNTPQSQTMPTPAVVQRTPNPAGEMRLHVITAGYAINEQARLMADALRGPLTGRTVTLDTLAEAVGIELADLTALEFDLFDFAAKAAFAKCGWTTRKHARRRGK